LLLSPVKQLRSDVALKNKEEQLSG